MKELLCLKCCIKKGTESEYWKSMSGSIPWVDGPDAPGCMNCGSQAPLKDVEIPK